MRDLPFSAYDAFAYLASGAVVLVAFEQAYGFPDVIGRDHTATEGTLLLLGAFIAGQIVAELSQSVLENSLVHRLLRPPSYRLMRDDASFLLRSVFPTYARPLPTSVRSKVEQRAAKEGLSATAEDLFLHVRFHRSTLDDAPLMAKLSIFVTQYGSARGLCMAFAIATLLFLVAARQTHSPDMVNYAAISGVVSFALLYRFLKFYRQYTFELLNCYGAATS